MTKNDVVSEAGQIWSLLSERKIHEYSNGELTIIWQPNICQHAGICVKMLPKVYTPKERPWIKIENATTAELIDQIGKCPSGALTYRRRKRSLPLSSIR